MAKVNFLHLSDLHLGPNFVYNNVVDLAIRISEEVIESGLFVDAIIFTGDIFEGSETCGSMSPSRVQDAVTFFDSLLERLVKKVNPSLSKKDVLFVPGNHDISRGDPAEQFSIYKQFLTKFYNSDEMYSELIDSEYLSTIRIFNESKVAVLGLNSCKIQQYPMDKGAVEWVNNLDLAEFGISTENASKIKDKFKQKNAEALESKWYSYGEIEAQQLTKAFDALTDIIGTDPDFRVVVAFHHHIYPFPEILTKYGDISLIKNFETVLQKLQRNKVNLVLHGHKHIPLIRPVANDAYLKDPKSLLYVVSAGTVGNKTTPQRTFQVIEVFSTNEPKIAKVSKFQFTLEMSEPIQQVLLPPNRLLDKDVVPENLLSIVKAERLEMYEKYESQIQDKDNISRDHGAESVLKWVSEVLTGFPALNDFLNRNPELAMLTVIFCHLRILASVKKYENSQTQVVDVIKKQIEQFLAANFVLSEVLRKVINSYLFSIPCKEKLQKLREIKGSARDNKISALVVVTAYFVDLYLMLAKYADVHCRNIEHKMNVRVPENSFHQYIPSNYIKLYSNTDRRSVIVSLKSKNPTAHKIAVLLIKEFEMDMSKFEKEFDELELKIYYLSSQVEKEKGVYDLENYNFEAYIPTLLPLLIGRNLYKQKEVFARELIQNALDAIILRNHLQKDSKANQTIRVTFGTEDYFREENCLPLKRFFFRVTDSGVGMDQLHVERYFIHIGRSYYVSDEFKELIEKNETKYRPISKFGIGFLSAFMACNEIRVNTKKYNKNGGGLNILIPNHDGCFFINADPAIVDGGTTVTLYEDESNAINIQKLITYIKKTILDLSLDVSIAGIHKNGTTFSEDLPSLKIRKDTLKTRSQARPVFFIPFYDNGFPEYIEEGVEMMSPFGITFQYDPQNETKIVEMNGGILLSSPARRNIFSPIFFNVYINYPPCYLTLDVSRERVVSYNKIPQFNCSFDSPEFKTRLSKILAKHIDAWIGNTPNGNEAKMTNYDKIIQFFEGNFNLTDLQNILNIKMSLANEDEYQMSFDKNNSTSSVDFKKIVIKGTDFPIKAKNIDDALISCALQVPYLYSKFAALVIKINNLITNSEDDQLENLMHSLGIVTSKGRSRPTKSKIAIKTSELAKQTAEQLFDKRHKPGIRMVNLLEQVQQKINLSLFEKIRDTDFSPIFPRRYYDYDFHMDKVDFERSTRKSSTVLPKELDSEYHRNFHRMFRHILPDSEFNGIYSSLAASLYYYIIQAFREFSIEEATQGKTINVRLDLIFGSVLRRYL